MRDAATLRFFAKCLSQSDPEILTPIMRGEWLRGFDWQSLLDRVRCPVLLLQGNPELGGMLINEDAAALCEGLADCTHVRLSDVGHHLHWQQTEAVLRFVHAFLDSLETSAD